MAWSFVEVVRTEQAWGDWYSLVTFALDSPASTESHWLHFTHQPTDQEVLDKYTLRLADINEAGAQAEFVWMVQNNSFRTLVYQTAAQLATRFRAAYQNGTGAYAGQLATWLLARITDGTFTDTQVRNAFGLTVTQYNAMKTRMQTTATNYAAVVAAAGE
jgi:hypothetical protein